MRVLPADVYDTLEFSALVFGGIGQGPLFGATPSGDFDLDCPNCAHGHAVASTGITDTARAVATYTGHTGISAVLFDADIGGRTSDLAVSVINRRHKHLYGERVSFPEWCAELEVVRGE